MKRKSTPLILTFAIFSGILAGAQAQENKEPETTTETKPINPMEKVWKDFMNLPEEKRVEFGEKLVKVQNLFNQKRVFDTLEGIDELDAIFPNHPAALNIKGACYVEMRAFDKARNIFNEILKLAPENANVHFNMAEIDFVTKQWQSAHERFEKLVGILEGEHKKAMKRLCEFKLLLCKLKLNKVKEAKELSQKYDDWDDSPFYYYSRAAISYHEDDKLEAAKMLRSVRYIWRNDAALSAWQDTLIEYGYIQSFYGGNLGEKEPADSE